MKKTEADISDKAMDTMDKLMRIVATYFDVIERTSFEETLAWRQQNKKLTKSDKVAINKAIEWFMDISEDILIKN